MKILLALAGLLFIGVALIPLAVIWIEYQQASNNSKALAGALPPAQSRTAVIVFSRSGNTAVLARHIAEREQADFIRLEASDYRLGLMGWLRALRDARSNEAVITPSKIDLSEYETVYLGSPIWLYSPAPPLWEFAANNGFDDKEVVLFNTFNSKFEADFIAQFEKLVRDRGAKSFEHQFINRGRMGQQISAEQMLIQFDSEFGDSGDR